MAKSIAINEIARNNARDFMMRQLNIPEALDSILNLMIPEKIIEKGDEN